MAPSNEQFKQAVAVLRKGGVVVFPTETAYGLAADTGNPRAAGKIFAIKGRGHEKKLPAIAASAAMAQRYAEISPKLMNIARAFWPGPLTVVGSRAAVRVSPHPIARALSKALGRPIFSTSANVSGMPTCYSVVEVSKQFARRRLQPDFALDVGPLPRRKPSTIIAEQDGRIVVLRQGSLRIPKRYVA
jgi:L-threonylcarbamoyladenylate synthase